MPANWRMTLARDHLRDSELGLAPIADAIGYGSPRQKSRCCTTASGTGRTETGLGTRPARRSSMRLRCSFRF